MRKADEFIELYNQLADYLAELTGANKWVPFYEIVNQAAAVSEVVRREAARLRKYGDLRNAIVHDGQFPREVVAEPTSETLARFRQLVQYIANPKRLDSFRKPIKTYSPEDKLVAALQFMGSNDFSQVVVRKDGKLSLLTAEGVARWLEKQAEQDIISVVEALVGDALAYDVPSSFSIMSREKTVDAAHAVFANAIQQGRPRLFAIIVTQNGKETETPLGLVTPWDLMEH